MLTTAIFLTGAAVESVNAQSTSGVLINGVPLRTDVVMAIARATGYVIPNGRYWYDKTCGAWGMEGGPTLGFGVAGLDLGGPLKPDASNGRTGTFINGRELPYQDVASLNALISPYRVQRGRFWVDAYGNFGYEHGGALGNLVQIAQAKSGGQGGRRSGGYDSGIGSVMSDGSGFIGFISGSSSATKY